MPSCPECETALNIDVEEVEEGDVIACDECGTEYEVVGVDPLELARVEEAFEALPAGPRSTFLSPAAWAQNIGIRTVSGTVLDAGSQPVPRATVFLKDE